MKTTFTLQDLQSIPKQKWLDYIEKHATQDVVAGMYEWHKKWGKSGEDREREEYRVWPKGYGILILTFIEEKIYSKNISEYDKQEEKYVFPEIMKDMNYLVMSIFKLNFDSPLLIANKVVEMLNELMNS